MQALLNNISWSKLKFFVNVSNNLKLLRGVCNGRPHCGKHVDGPSRQYIKKGPGLEYFIYNSIKGPAADNSETIIAQEKHPYLNKEAHDGCGLKGNLQWIKNGCLIRVSLE